MRSAIPGRSFDRVDRRQSAIARGDGAAALRERAAGLPLATEGEARPEWARDLLTAAHSPALS